MRLWTIHPKYLDARGLVALWREALLAKKVLKGVTKGYRNHPQLLRFRRQTDPLAAISFYMAGVLEESLLRGYSFDASKIEPARMNEYILETDGQLIYELNHLSLKLRKRCPELYLRLKGIEIPEAHPVFKIVPGCVRAWERKSL